MTLQPAAILMSFAAFCSAAPAQAASRQQTPSPILLAQAVDGSGQTSTAPVSPDAGVAPAMPGIGTTPPAAAGGNPAPASANSGNSAQSGATAGSAAIPLPTQNPAPTTATRNGRVALPTFTQQAPTGPNPGSPSITFGGPQVDVQPVYGSTLRDNGAGNGGVPVYSTGPTTLGGPINGTANPYYATLPNGTGTPGQTTSTSRNTQAPNGNAYATQQPLGARPYTRDQGGTFGGTANGYSAQGIYNGTAAQTGVGYGSPYAGSGRPTGGLLPTGVDATAPLRPYVPADGGPIGRPNSGYGIPNGARSTHMDGRGVQRLD